MRAACFAQVGELKSSLLSSRMEHLEQKYCPLYALFCSLLVLLKHCTLNIKTNTV